MRRWLGDWPVSSFPPPTTCQDTPGVLHGRSWPGAVTVQPAEAEQAARARGAPSRRVTPGTERYLDKRGVNGAFALASLAGSGIPDPDSGLACRLALDANLKLDDHSIPATTRRLRDQLAMSLKHTACIHPPLATVLT